MRSICTDLNKKRIEGVHSKGSFGERGEPAFDNIAQIPVYNLQLKSNVRAKFSPYSVIYRTKGVLLVLTLINKSKICVLRNQKGVGKGNTIFADLEQKFGAIVFFCSTVGCLTSLKTHSPPLRNPSSNWPFSPAPPRVFFVFWFCSVLHLSLKKIKQQVSSIISLPTIPPLNSSFRSVVVVDCVPGALAK